jgi:hypothetical protein
MEPFTRFKPDSSVKSDFQIKVRTKPMKTQHNRGVKFPSSKNTSRNSGLFRISAVTLFVALLTTIGLPLQATPHHDIAAANLNVQQNDTGNTTNSVTITAPLSINDMQVRVGSIRGTYSVQIGPDVTDDATTGVLIGAVSQNGRDNGETSANRKGINYCFPHAGLTTVTNPTAGYNLYSDADATPTTNVNAKYNINVAGAWFPFSTWVGGRAYNSTNANPSFGSGITNDTVTGTSGLTYGQNIYEPSSGNYVVDLTSFGIDSRTDGILLVNSGKAEANWANSAANSEDGTWNVRVKDGNADNGAGSESDYFAFVFVPKTNTSVVSGQFLGDGSISIFSGVSPQFTVSSNSVGTYELKIPGYNPTNGVLIVSPDQSGTKNVDNMVTYQANPANNGWIIQTRDYPGIGSPLEALASDEIVCSFVFIPADNDLPNLVFSPATVSVVEGRTNTFTVALKSQPTADVIVTVNSGDTTQGATVSPTTLTFTSGNWNVPQSVSVFGVDDLNSDGNTIFQITNSATSTDINYGALSPSIVLATTLDNEPAVSLPSGGSFYTTGSTGVGVDGGATISDVNTTNYDGTTLVVTITANGSVDDRLEIRSTGTDPGQISVAGNTVSYGGVAIATFSGGTGTTPLSVSFNTNAAPTNAQALLQSVSFHNVSATPNSAARSVSVVVTHPDTGFGSASTTVRLSALNVNVFQQNVDSGYGTYTNEADCEIQKNNDQTSFPTGGNNISGLFVDNPLPGGNANQVLMRFDNLFGNNPGQIPTNALIISADLSLHILDSGDGTPLYRMKIPWDANFSTWSGLGGGVDLDDIEARTNYDSVFGLTFDKIGGNSPNTGLGTITFSVLPDVKAWQSGDANFGWVLPGSDQENDGLGISPGESSNPNDRPKLRITWMPAGTAVATFRQGVNGYTSAQDTRIRAVEGDTNAAAFTTVFVDWAVTGPTENDDQVLIRFDNIIGYGPGQIFPNSVVHAAVLDINSTDLGNAMGDGGTFHSMLIPWDQTNTWNSFTNVSTNGILANDVMAVAASSANAGNSNRDPNIEAAFHVFDLTADVQAWVAGVRPNYGWVILPWPNGGDGWGFDTSDATNEIQRPQLRVYYTPGPLPIMIQSIQRTTTNVVLTVSGAAGSTYSLRRASTVDGAFSVIGSATIQGGGTGTFTDNSPLTGAAFYRISNP